MKLNDYNFQKLIRNFYNDTYLVDQNACTSPHLILWIGKSNLIAKKKFWNALSTITPSYLIHRKSGNDWLFRSILLLDLQPKFQSR